ncbi:hypothetical protein Sjap_001521 [Stephania japonica]|uniref:Cation/H+ exchanger domain-containing protein n=1 Tax=Stephania japonica TaxID=461633 RepID=A0AAP0KK47_9MAGN
MASSSNFSTFPDYRNHITCRFMGKMPQNGLFFGGNPFYAPFPRILLMIALVTILTRIVHFLLRPLKQPRVVAEIIAGIILGPSGLSQNKTFANAMFPKNGTLEYQTMSILAMMLFIFVIGLRMDTMMVKNAEKKVLCAGLFGMALPFLLVCTAALYYHGWINPGMSSISSAVGLASSLSMTGFMVIYLILKELKLLNSDIGRLALNTAMVTDAAGFNAILLFETMKQSAHDKSIILKFMTSVAWLGALVLFVLRPMASWVSRKTLPGQPVSQFYVVVLMVSVLVMGFLSDFIGATVVEGPLLLALVLPDGPPIGTTLVARTETIVELLMPLVYVQVGQIVDVYSVNFSYRASRAFAFIVFVGYVGKYLGTVLPLLYFKMPLRDSLTLGFIMGLRGQVELFTYLHWLDYKASIFTRMLEKEDFTLLVLLLLLITAISGPMIAIMDRPIYTMHDNKRRTIEQLPPSAELHMLTCIYNQENVPALLKLLDANYAPIAAYALHLVELTGRATPMFISHRRQRITGNYKHTESSKPIVAAFKNYEKETSEHVQIQAFTAVSPYNTMYRDIRRLALEKKACLVIMPFQMRCNKVCDNQGTTYRTERMVNAAVQSHAPCSIGIFIDKGRHRTRAASSYSTHYVAPYRIIVLFLGGPDSREALAYANRMVGKINVSMSVVRFELSDGNNEDKREDDEAVQLFVTNNLKRENVVYNKVVVKDGLETVSVIRRLNDGKYDLWIVGRGKGVSSSAALVRGLSEWSENCELGVVGDFIASPDFEGTASVLVLQQHVVSGTQEEGGEGDDS